MCFLVQSVARALSPKVLCVQYMHVSDTLPRTLKFGLLMHIQAANAIQGKLEYERQLINTLRKRSRSPGSAEHAPRRLAVI